MRFARPLALLTCSLALTILGCGSRPTIDAGDVPTIETAADAPALDTIDAPPVDVSDALDAPDAPPPADVVSPLDASDAADTGPTDPCIPNPCMQPMRTRCSVVDSTASCACDPGTHETPTGCVADVRCDTTTCGGHGRCEDATGTPVCTCDAAYTGTFCDACVTGFYPDGHGGCTATPCEPNPCTDPMRSRCTVASTGAVCDCNAGTHDVMGTCAPDATCSPTTCSGHGSCTADATGTHCACDMGYAGARCDTCTPDLHPDGMGNCTADLCVPNPCAAAHRSVCSVVSGLVTCACETGYHLESGACVPDETCAGVTCSSHGTCAVVGGRALCTCAPGYASADCSTCATGYHADGAGGCTSDPCLPNPCTTIANRSVCTSTSGSAVCTCSAGYHDDGIGGCTTDPCTPDPCAAGNQACRVNAGMAECYTPVCNDNNPCTTDTLVGGSCTFTNRADGSSCATSMCTAGQQCVAGACTGGNAVVCNDGNPCTRDSCDPTAGCRAVNDDTLVPSDSYSCTTDRCSAGVASHVATDSVCDDGRWCTGAERCSPTTAGADARGCIAGTPPAPPGPSSACAAYVCNDTAMSYSLVMHTGDPCNDTIACTTGDVCNASGACVGTLITPCPVTGVSCTSTTMLGSAFDIPTARVRGVVRLDGANLPASVPGAMVPNSQYTYLYLVAHDTGVRHTLATVTYNYGSTAYTLQAMSDRIDANIVPGIYDLLFSHNTSGSDPVVGARAPTDPIPSGFRILRNDIVIGPGSNTLDVDLAGGHVQGSITLNGAAMPATLPGAMVPNSQYTYLYLVNADTGARHGIATLTYNYGSTAYTLQSMSDRVNANVPPGTYDLVYSHNTSGSGPVSAARAPSDPLPSGDRVIRTGITIAAGTNSLDVDIASGRVQGAVTLGGAAMPATLPGAMVPNSQYTYLYLVSRDTGAQHGVATVTYNYGSTAYTLQSMSDRVDANVPPGTYDLLLTHNTSGSGPVTAARAPADPIPSAQRIIRSGIVVAAGSNSLDVDLSAARVHGVITLGGAAMPATLPGAMVPNSQYTYLYLVSNETGARHTIGTLTYNYGSTAYTLQSMSDRIDANIPPGSYDLLVSHNLSGSGPYIASRAPADPIPSGQRVLRTGIVVAAGSNTLDVDLRSARVNGRVTLDGANFATSVPGTQVPNSQYTYLYLVASETGVLHTIATITYNYGSTAYTLQSMSDLIDANVPPGTYDLLLSHNISGSSPYVAARSPADPIPATYRYIRRGIVLTAGANALDIDIRSSRPMGTVTLDGAVLARSVPPAQVPNSQYTYLYLVSNDTAVRQTLATVTYNYGSTAYTLQSMSDLVNANVPPGTYDLLFSHNVSGSGPYVGARAPADPIPSGERLLRTCVSVP